MFYKGERLALFIDGQNLFAAAKALEFDIDYKLLRAEFMRRGQLVRAYYYMRLLDTAEYSPIRPLLDWLAHNGFTVVSKPAKEITDPLRQSRVKLDMDIELTIDALELAPRVDHVVLFSGARDLQRLVESLQRQGLRISIASTIRTRPPLIANELRRQADSFIELNDLRGTIGRQKGKLEPGG